MTRKTALPKAATDIFNWIDRSIAAADHQPADLVPASKPLVFIRNGFVHTTSNRVAEQFEKRHADVLRDIRGLSSSAHTPPDYFIASSYIDSQNGQSYPSYDLSRSGFDLLAMGFTGDKALKFKVDYINAFNAMEAGPSGQQPAAPVSAVASLALAREQRLAQRETRLLLTEKRHAVNDIFATLPRLSDSSKQAIYSSMYAPVGIAIPAPTVPKLHSTTELAEARGMSPITLGKLTNHLKTPENGEWKRTTRIVNKKVMQTDEHGNEVEITIPHEKQIEQWMWTETGRQAIADYLARQNNVVTFNAAD